MTLNNGALSWPSAKKAHLSAHPLPCLSSPQNSRRGSRERINLSFQAKPRSRFVVGAVALVLAVAGTAGALSKGTMSAKATSLRAMAPLGKASEWEMYKVRPP